MFVWFLGPNRPRARIGTRAEWMNPFRMNSILNWGAVGRRRRCDSWRRRRFPRRRFGPPPPPPPTATRPSPACEFKPPRFSFFCFFFIFHFSVALIYLHVFLICGPTVSHKTSVASYLVALVVLPSFFLLGSSRAVLFPKAFILLKGNWETNNSKSNSSLISFVSSNIVNPDYFYSLQDKCVHKVKSQKNCHTHGPYDCGQDGKQSTTVHKTTIAERVKKKLAPPPRNLISETSNFNILCFFSDQVTERAVRTTLIVFSSGKSYLWSHPMLKDFKCRCSSLIVDLWRKLKVA